METFTGRMFGQLVLFSADASDRRERFRFLVQSEE